MARSNRKTRPAAREPEHFVPADPRRGRAAEPTAPSDSWGDQAAPAASEAPQEAAPASGTFVSRVPYEHTHPRVLAVYCSDGRFTDAVEDLAQHLGHERIDTLTIPGGPGMLNRWVADYMASEFVTHSARFLIAGHHITEVLLLAHAGCGYYQSRHGGLGPEFIAHQQLEDLRFAARELKQAHPGLTVHLYFVRPHGTRIHFEPVSES
jgi:hypothetical protein